MIVLLIIVGIGLFLAVNGSSKDHYQEWREQQPPGVGHKIYPGTFDLGEVVGVLVLAIIILVIVSML